MKWNAEDLEKYVQAKEYIDTLIIPLQPFHMVDEKSLVNDAFASNILTISCDQMEAELSGRVVLSPPYSYVKSTDLEREIDRLNEWVAHVKEQPFESVFFITYDMQWKKIESSLEGHLIWLPIGKKINVQSQEAKVFVQNQVEHISEYIRSFWV